MKTLTLADFSVACFRARNPSPGPEEQPKRYNLYTRSRDANRISEAEILRPVECKVVHQAANMRLYIIKLCLRGKWPPLSATALTQKPSYRSFNSYIEDTKDSVQDRRHQI